MTSTAEPRRMAVARFTDPKVPLDHQDYLQIRWLRNICYEQSAKCGAKFFLNPRPDGVWQVARPDGGGGKGLPLRISGTNSWIGKTQTAFERSHRVDPELVPLTSLT